MANFKSHLFATLPVLLMFGLTAVTIWSRPLLPVDETRYFSVAWEMHERGDLLVPHLNGESYSHKPPMLFWLINLVWTITDLESAAARWVAPMIGAACLLLTRRLTQELWPDDAKSRECAPLICVSMLLWSCFTTTTMFDTLLTMCSLLALIGIVRASHGHQMSGWLLAGVAMGCGILSKGPVVFVHCLPTALLIRYWHGAAPGGLQRWASGVLASIVIAAAIALAWALPAAVQGGDAFANELLYGQTAGRMVQSFAHRRAVWWYLPVLPLCLCPWIICGGLLRGCRTVPRDAGLRLLIVQLFASFVILSAVSGKQAYYLLPLLPLSAILFARVLTHAGAFSRRDRLVIALGTLQMALVPIGKTWLDRSVLPGLSETVSSIWTIPFALCALSIMVPRTLSATVTVRCIACAAVIFIGLTQAGLSHSFWAEFNLQPLADRAAKSGRPLAWYGNYHGQLNYLGRIPRVDEIFNEQDLRSWLMKHPDGILIARCDGAKSQQEIVLPIALGHWWEPNVMATWHVRRGLTVGPVCLIRFKQPPSE